MQQQKPERMAARPNLLPFSTHDSYQWMEGGMPKGKGVQEHDFTYEYTRKILMVGELVISHGVAPGALWLGFLASQPASQHKPAVPFLQNIVYSRHPVAVGCIGS